MTTAAAPILIFLYCVAPAGFAQDTQTGQVYLIRSRQSIASGRFQEALKQADEALLYDSNNAEAHAHRATALNRLERYPEALESALRSLKSEPRNGYAMENLAWAQVRMGRYKDAAVSATQAIELKPNSALAYALRAQAHEGLHLTAESLADIGKAARLDPITYGPALETVRSGGHLLEAAGDSEPAWPLIAAAALVIIAAGGLWLTRGGDEASRTVPAESNEQVLAAGGLLAGRYKLVHVIGRGGMGKVWKGIDTTLQRPVALKQVLQRRSGHGNEMREYFLKEARTIASLRHPNIAEIYEILDHPEGPFMVLELLTGRSLLEILVEHKTLPPAEIKRYLLPVCAALSHAHERGFVHRDIKPANIMATSGGGVKLLDFGIAHLMRDSAELPGERADAAGNPPRVSLTHHVYGTPGYMPPEAERGVVTPATDIYALGVTFYEMLTGRLAPSPFSGGASPAVDELMRRSVEPDWERRLASASEFAALLATL